MDGKLFLYDSLTPPRISYPTVFVFDLQRFTSTDPGTSFLTEGLSITKNNVETVYYSSEEAVGNATQQSGDLFEVSDKDGGNKRYFSNIHAALNYVYDAQTTGETPTKIYKDSNTYKATIKLLGDVTNGKPFMLGGKEYEYENELSVTVEDSDITIDLDGHSYLFAEALTSDTTAGLGRAKGITTEDDNKRSMSGAQNNTDKAYVTIKNGSFGVAANASAKFERMIKSYINLTLDSVTIDGSNFPVAPAGVQGKKNGLEKSFDGAIVNQSGGTLNIIGSTSIIAPEGYYAVSEKLSGKSNHGSNEFNFAVNTTGTISNIAFYEWKGEDTIDTANNTEDVNFSKSGNGISIGGGNIGQVMFSEKALNTGAMTITSINGGALINSITYGNSANSLAYAESTVPSPYWVNNSSGKFFYFGKDGWNPDSTTEKKFNFVAESVASGNTNKLGQIIIAAEGATNTDSFAYDSGNKVIGLPTDITATWGPGLENSLKSQYAVAKMDYNGSAKDAVTISEVSLGSSASDAYVKLVAKADSLPTSTGLFAETVKKIDASALSIAASIVGNSLDNTIYGGTGSDSLTGGVGTATSLRGSNTFYYSAGNDVITDFNRNTDKIVITTDDFAPAASQINSLSDNQFGISLSDTNKISLNSSAVFALAKDNVLPTNGIKVAAERNGREIANYVYTAYSVADMTGDKANGVTLNSAAAVSTVPSAQNSFTADNPFVTIDASATSIAGGFNITGFTNANYILAGQNGGSLNGNGGDDTLRGGDGADVFIYSAGKNVIEEYKDNDVLSMATNNITGAESSRKGLVFSTKNSSNILTFKPVGDAETAVEKVSLNGGGFLTKDGAVNSIGSDANPMKFNLFAGTKGAIDLVNDTIYNGAGIASIDAKDSKNSVTLTGNEHIKSLTLGANTKKDVFVYGGGNITISGYEGGKDRLNIADKGAVSLFTVDDTSGDVNITVGSNSANVISLKGAQGQEVLIHDENSRGSSFSKFVFAKTGVLYNKEKPTKAMIYSNAGSFTEAPSSLKKIFALENVSRIKIASSDNKTTLDASEAGASVVGSGIVGVSLEGGTKSNKFIASGGKDTFIYKGGKDVIEDFGVASENADSISFGDSTAFSVESAKITLSKKSIKFKFDSKNILTLKNDASIGGTFQIGDTNYTYAKNSIADGNQVSLTSQFSGSYKLEDGINNVDGHLVQKNLTFKGTSAQETLIGGQKKTTFKGGGGADSLVGGSGKDVFFYAKGDSGTSTIANFDFDKDRLKIANGTISKIESLSGGGVQFAMKSGKRGDTSPIGWFNVTTNENNDSIENTKVAIKANSTLYWFATENDKNKYVSASTGEAITVGDLITLEKKVAKSQLDSGYEILDLGYSTNLAKTDVAIKVTTQANYQSRNQTE